MTGALPFVGLGAILYFRVRAVRTRARRGAAAVRLALLARCAAAPPPCTTGKGRARACYASARLFVGLPCTAQ